MNASALSWLAADDRGAEEEHIALHKKLLLRDMKRRLRVRLRRIAENRDRRFHPLFLMCRGQRQSWQTAPRCRLH